MEPYLYKEAIEEIMIFLFLEGDIAYFELPDGKAAFKIAPEYLETFSKMKEGDKVKFKKS